ncbi:unnamed protein product [Rotaria sp. Silwood2]|nr:unnamed protein product [Rotaria sp. Silwood2]
MPLIDLLLQKKANIIIAGNGDSFFLLKDSYPDLKFYELPGYDISYAVAKNASVQTLLQGPKVLKTISKENKVIEEIVATEKIDLIISDNRYGVRNANVKSILICHHIALQAPDAMKFMNPILLKLHLRQIHKFDALWIPDEENETNLSGILSHNILFKIPHAFIGIQSRFANYKQEKSFIDEIDFEMLVVLSGPEPQRTYLETELKKKLQTISSKILLIRGKTETDKTETVNNITVINYLNTNDLFAALQKAKIIICRSGYSTVMDLGVLGKKAIFIPAEGQTEQEYLAKILAEKGFAVECQQHYLEIEKAIKKLETITGFHAYKTSTEKLEIELNKHLI